MEELKHLDKQKFSNIFYTVFVSLYFFYLIFAMVNIGNKFLFRWQISILFTLKPGDLIQDYTPFAYQQVIPQQFLPAFPHYMQYVCDIMRARNRLRADAYANPGNIAELLDIDRYHYCVRYIQRHRCAQLISVPACCYNVPIDSTSIQFKCSNISKTCIQDVPEKGSH